MWWAALIGYGLLALLTAFVGWRNEHTRLVGMAVLLGYALSNGAITILSPAELPAAFTVIEVMISSITFVCWFAGGPRILSLVVMASTASIISNLAITFVDTPSLPQLRLWIAIANICFIVECLATICGGLWGHVRQADRDHRPDHSSQASKAHARDPQRTR